MDSINKNTLRRLQKLPQINSVWEGDRRPIRPGDDLSMIGNSETVGECIMWVDGSQGSIRGTDVVMMNTGPEAIVRTLLRAMEHPQGPGIPARPQKIVVRDREIQFLLRGVLQDLEIKVEYESVLPLIDEIFRGIQESVENRPPEIPVIYAQPLEKLAKNIWSEAPWEVLSEHQVIAITVNQWDVEKLYVSCMGQMGMDYGILMYRSLESLKRFRQLAIQEKDIEKLEGIFLSQDCLFLTYASSGDDDEDDDDNDFEALLRTYDEMEPNFGNLHPLEGLRSILYEEEAVVMLVALEAFYRFLQEHENQLDNDPLPLLNKTYKINVLTPKQKKQSLNIKVETLPDVEKELYEMLELYGDEDDDDDDYDPILRDDLIPDNSLLSLGVLPWDTINNLRGLKRLHTQLAGKTIKQAGEGLPVVLIQTTSPKAKQLIADIVEASGLMGIGFTKGEDPYSEQLYDLGVLKTGDDNLHLFGEFVEDDHTHREARKKWDKRCKDTENWCALLIAKGVTGVSKGKPSFKEFVGYFEVPWLSAKEMKLGNLRLTPVTSIEGF
jgi:hypothetical protein